MKNEDDFYIKAEELETKGFYKELFSVCLKYSKSNNQELANAATRYLATIYSNKRVSLNKLIEYESKIIQFEQEKELKSTALENIAITYRFKGDLQAYKYFLEKAIILNDSSAALALANLYSVSSKENVRIEKLLKIILNDDKSLEEDKNEAKQLQNDIANNHYDHIYLLSKAPLIRKKLPYKKPLAITGAVEDLLLNAITNYELGEYKKAFKQLRKLANTYRLAEAMLYLGNCYYYGKGIDPSYDKAATWYHCADEHGNLNAILKLANLYKDIGQILLYKYYLENAMAHGNDKAILLLAELYAVSEKEIPQVKMLLQKLLRSQTATVDLIYKAETLLKQLE
ncbi:hypothetical protein DKL61_06655 [Gammaproteobacteria bacterium ESL0073]|nr:hypothetical protein DKL61_06655 [Gammaproteobacteria bacterium ESL0073]